MIHIDAELFIGPGRTARFQVCRWNPPAGFLTRFLIATEEGVLAAIPLTMDRSTGGPTWPPLPFDDWLMVSKAYRDKVAALMPPPPDDGY